MSDDFAELMEDFPGADNHGRQATERLPVTRNGFDGEVWPPASRELNIEIYEITQALLGQRMDIAPGDETYFGMVAHRGVLTADEFEYLDWDVIRERVAEALGSSGAELDRLYGHAGRLFGEALTRREHIDSLLLNLQEAGSNMHMLAATLGWPTQGSRSRKMTKVLARAREARG